MIYLVTPDSTLFFRGGEPMGMGESHFQSSVFPPSPETFIGAIRTYVIATCGNADFDGYKNGKYEGEKWYTEIGGPEGVPESFKFAGPFLRKGSELLFPVPSNLFAYREKKNTESPGSAENSEKKVIFDIARPREIRGVYSSGSFEHFRKSRSFNGSGHERVDFHDSGNSEYFMWCESFDSDRHDQVELHRLFMKAKGLQKYLRGDVKLLDIKEDFISSDAIFAREERTGIALDRRSRTVREGHLYVTGHFRFQEDAGFAFNLEGVPSFPERGLMKLGGENRIVSFCRNSNITVPTGERNINMLYLTVPCRVRKVVSGMPLLDFMTDEMEILFSNGKKAEVLACSISKPVFYGGWDLARKRSKTMVQYVPAGSVFYFNEIEAECLKNGIMIGGRHV